MKKFLSVLFTCFVLLFTLCLVACGDNPDNPDDPADIDWDSKTISTVELDAESFAATYDVDDFKVGLLQLHITYTDGTSRNIPCTKDMFEDSDYKKFSSPGTKKVTVMYGDLCEDTKVNIIDYAVADMNLNLKGTYDAVFKIIRNQRTGKLDFIVEPKKGVTFGGVQAKFVFDKDKIELSNFVTNAETNGYGSYTFDKESCTLIITYVTDKPITVETTLFSCDFTGDFRFSGLKADEAFANRMYTLDEEEGTFNTQMMQSILLHVSQK